MRKTIAKRENKPKPLIGLISSKNPVPALIETVKSLFRGGCTGVIVVDDGSDDEAAKEIFDKAEQAGAQVIHLEKNVGKAKALQAGFRALPKGAVIIQTDDDTLSGDLRGPLSRIRSGKADIVDIRVEVMRTQTLVGLVQELSYWLTNTIMKRFQDCLRARIWMSGASVMYSYKAGKVLIMEKAYSMTEDTEGLFRARIKGFKVRYHASYNDKFLTMVPEDINGVVKQWRRWTTGTGQIIGRYGLGGGNARIVAVNLFCWGYMLLPVYKVVVDDTLTTLLWMVGAGAVLGFFGAIRLRRARMAAAGIFLPALQLIWIVMAFAGLWLAWRLSRKGTGQSGMAWVSPKRTTVLELTDQIPSVAK
jgi:cellulose synthase/poly-beta-1,6-N-acetylglucosamine synthase-like glycosyltransferase